MRRTEFDEDLIISYGDIVYTKSVLEKVMKSKFDFNIAIDINWKNYWKKRYGKIDFDTESLKLDNSNNIVSLGLEKTPIDEIDGRYVGLMKFSKNGLSVFERIYDEAKKKYWDSPWQHSKKPFKQAYMTDIIQELIDRKYKINSVLIEGGWMEFDTNQDYEKQKKLNELKNIKNFIMKKLLLLFLVLMKKKIFLTFTMR